MANIKIDPVDKFTHNIGLIVRDAAVNAGLDENSLWTLMGCFHKEIGKHYAYVHDIVHSEVVDNG